jgi:S-adenosyl-L-methionine hydrolase (adenosine-forming)
MAASPLIALLTDFGLEDGYPGVMKGVVLGITPEARFIDISHLIPAQDVATGAWILHTTWRYFPAGTIFLSVVDPGVGTGRKAIALHVDDWYFVGPDNGLFSYVLSTARSFTAVQLDRAEYHLPSASNTFQGRDIFAPCAAHLAAGVPLEELGSRLDPETLTTLVSRQPSMREGSLEGTIVHCDHFGNLITSFGPVLAEEILKAPASILAIGNATITARAPTFAAGPAGEPFLFADSSGYLAIAVRDASAASRLSARRGDQVWVSGLDHPPQP